tara:strand:- start:220 stop:408 length:189 start_codon:yes stop_codon:yes gene_type:complete
VHACIAQSVFLQVDVVVAAAADNRQQVLGAMVVMYRDEQVVLGEALGLQAKPEFRFFVETWK